jgi:GLPGLI family protein
LLTFAITQVNAQEILDTAVLRCKYTLSHITDTANNKGYSENMILEIGKSISKFYSQDQIKRNKQFVEAVKKGLESQQRNIVIPSDIQKSRVATILYFNYPTGKIKTFDKVLPDIYQYE